MAGGVLGCPLTAIWQYEFGGSKAACTWTGSLPLLPIILLPGLNKLKEGTFPRSQEYHHSEFSNVAEVQTSKAMEKVLCDYY